MKRMSLKVLLALATVLLLAPAAHAAADAWVEAMTAVHEKGKGKVEKGSVSQIGDSITFTKAFLAGMAWGGNPKGEEWNAVRSRVNGKYLNDRKGGNHGNYSGWVCSQGVGKIKGVLSAEKPEIAVIMYGTNDVRKGVTPEQYKAQLAQIVDACLEFGTVPIVSTIPPLKGNGGDKVEGLNAAIKALATEKKIPLVDFHAETLKLQPGDACFGTIISGDGVHPSGGDNMNFSEENMKKCGYALRNYITIKAMQDVITKCFKD